MLSQRIDAAADQFALELFSVPTDRQHAAHDRFLTYCAKALNGSDAITEDDVIAYSEIRDFGEVSFSGEGLGLAGQIVRKSLSLSSFQQRWWYNALRTSIDSPDISNRLHAKMSARTQYGAYGEYFLAIQSRITNIDTFVKDFPAGLLQQEAMFKLWRCIIGACLAHQYYMSKFIIADPVEFTDAVDIGILFGVAYALIDNVFDNIQALRLPDRATLHGVVRDTLVGRCELDFWKSLRAISEISDRVLRSAHFARAEEAFLYFADCQFDARKNTRLQLKSRVDPATLLRDSAKQAAASRIAFANFFGVTITDEVIHAAIRVGSHNQLTNDLEGISSDVRNTQTLFVSPVLGIPPLSLIHLVAETIVERAGRHRAVTERALNLRLLEAVAGSAGDVDASAYRNHYAAWMPPAAKSPNEADIVLRAARLIGPIHKEYQWLAPFIDRSRSLRVQMRRGETVGNRLLAAFGDVWRIRIQTGIDNLKLSPPAAYALRPPASRSRSLFFLFALDKLGVLPECCMHSAVAIECFHTASLILDDLPAHDNALVRRKRPATHIAFGEAAAQLAAVELISTGYALFSDKVPSPVSAVLIQQCHRRLCGRTGLIGGQIRDLRKQLTALTVSTARFSYVRTNIQKTGIPFQFALEAAAIQSDRANLLGPLGQIARRLGLAYQIWDDINDSELPAGVDENQAYHIAKTCIERNAATIVKASIPRKLCLALTAVGTQFLTDIEDQISDGRSNIAR